MKLRTARAAATLAVAYGFTASEVRAQPWPVPPSGATLAPWRGPPVADASLAPSHASAVDRPMTDEERDEIDRAVADIAAGHATLAAARLSERVAARRGDLRGYDVDAVLWRVAAGERARSRAASESASALPAPPDEREAMERSIDGAVELLIRHEARAAVEWIDAAMRAHQALPAYHPLRVLGRLARATRGVEVSAVSRARAAPTEPRSDRPRGTLDGGEAVVLFQLGAAYGLTLGAWGAVGLRGPDASPDDSPALTVVLPVLGAGAGMVVAALIDARRDVRRGRVYAANAGFYLGLVGALGAELLPDGPFSDSNPFERVSVFLGAGTAGLGLGIATAHATDSMPGSASFVLSGGVWGAMIGASLDRAFRDSGRSDGAVGLLAGEAIGAGAAMLTAHVLAPTPAQTRWLDLGALLGGLAGALLFSSTDSAQTSSLAGALGCVGGGALGFILGAPSEGERELARRLSARANTFVPTFTPLRGGGLFGLVM